MNVFTASYITYDIYIANSLLKNKKSSILRTFFFCMKIITNLAFLSIANFLFLYDFIYKFRIFVLKSIDFLSILLIFYVFLVLNIGK